MPLQDGNYFLNQIQGGKYKDYFYMMAADTINPFLVKIQMTAQHVHTQSVGCRNNMWCSVENL